MEGSENYSRYMVKSSAMVFTALVVAALFGLGLRIFLSRALSVENYGLFHAVLALFIFINIFPTLGLKDAITKYLPEFKVKKSYDDLKSSIIISLLIQGSCALAIAIALFIFSQQIAVGFFGSVSAVPLIQIFSVWLVVVVVVRAAQSVLSGFRDMTGYSIARGIEIPSAFVVVAILSTFLNIKTIHATLAYILSITITGTWILFRLRKHSPILQKGKVLIVKPLIKKLLVYGLPLILASMGFTIIGRIDTLVIVAFRTIREVGLYEVAYPAREFLTYFGTAVAIPLFPMLSELWTKKNRAHFRSTLHFLTKLVFVGMTPVMLVVLAFPGTIIRVLFGADYLGATLALQILSISAVVSALMGIPAQGLKAIGQTWLFGKIVVLSAIINLIGDILLVPLVGIEGAAAATLVTFSSGFLLFSYFVRKFTKFPVPLLSIIKVIIGGALTLLLVTGLKLIILLPLLPKLFAVIIPAGLFYIVWILTTGVLLRKDLRMLNRVMPMPKWLRKIFRRMTRE